MGKISIDRQFLVDNNGKGRKITISRKDVARNPARLKWNWELSPCSEGP